MVRSDAAAFIVHTRARNDSIARKVKEQVRIRRWWRHCIHVNGTNSKVVFWLLALASSTTLARDRLKQVYSIVRIQTSTRRAVRFLRANGSRERRKGLIAALSHVDLVVQLVNQGVVGV